MEMPSKSFESLIYRQTFIGEHAMHAINICLTAYMMIDIIFTGFHISYLCLINVNYSMVRKCLV